MSGQREDRKRAYRYVIEQAGKLSLDLNRRPDQSTTDLDYVSLNDLVALKEGLIDPPQHLVVALKKFLKGIANKDEIDEYLVKPFRTRI